MKSLPERYSNLPFGIFMHFGGTSFFIISLFFIDLTIVNLMLATSIAIFPMVIIVAITEYKNPIIKLDPIVPSDIFYWFLYTFIYSMFGTSAIIILIYYIFDYLFPYNLRTFSSLQILTNLILTDLCFYCIHRFLYHGDKRYRIVKFFYNTHKVHHNIRELDFIRGVDGTFLDAGIIAFSLAHTFLGIFMKMNLESILISYYICITLQFVHHVNYTFNISLLRFIFCDSHSHKIHHVTGAYNLNLGAVFSFWDSLFNTFYENPNINGNYMHHNNISFSRINKI